MGPSLGRLGDQHERERLLKAGQVEPQWGRASEGSETQNEPLSGSHPRHRRNGAEPRKARRRTDPQVRHTSGSTAPQWGRASEGSETARRGDHSTDLSEAAMGPSLGRLGDVGPVRRSTRRTTAAMGPSLGRLGDSPNGGTRSSLPCPPQWGRASEGSETGRGGSPPGFEWRCRNGAEPRKARRRIAVKPAVRRVAGRNGAEPRKARRRQLGPTRSKITDAAMGPSLGRLGDKRRLVDLPSDLDLGRNGAEPRKARRHAGLQVAQPRRRAAAMGPSLGRLGDIEQIADQARRTTSCRNGAEPRKARRLVPSFLTTVTTPTAAMGPSLGRLGD